MQMDLLENRVASLECQNDELLQQNTFLQKQNELLSTQNALLQERLQQQPEQLKLSQEQKPAVAVASSTPLESAEGTGCAGGSPAGSEPDQLGQLPGRSGDSSSQHVDLLELLTETLFGSKETSEGDTTTSAAPVVGTPAEDMEAGDDTITDADTLPAELLEPPSPADDELLAQLLRGACPEQLDELAQLQQEAAVPDSPQMSPESPSLPPSPAASCDLTKVKAETDDDWLMFDHEPLDTHFDDQFLLFPQLVL